MSRQRNTAIPLDVPFATGEEEYDYATGEYYEIGEDDFYEAGEDDDDEFDDDEIGLYEIGQDDEDEDEEEEEEEDEEEAAQAILDVLSSGQEDEVYDVGARRRRRRGGLTRRQLIARMLARSRARVRAAKRRRARARRRPAPRRRRPPPRTMPRGPMRGGIPVRKADPTQGRLLFLGFDSGTNIAAGATANVSTQPQDVFSPRKLIVPQTVAPNFTINDVKIGNISQFSSSAAVPAETFIPDAAQTDVRFDTAQVSQQIVWNVTNISGAAARFRASIEGYVLRL